MVPSLEKPPGRSLPGKIISSNRTLNRALCLAGCAGVLAGMLLGADILFLSGIAVGILGYLGVRRELKRAIMGGAEENDTAGED